MSKAASPIPAGFHSLTPHLDVQGAAAYIDFLKKAFNAVEVSRSPGPGGKIMNAQLRIGDSMLMLHDDMSAEFHMEPAVRGKLPIILHLYVPDVDTAFAQAVAAGCKELMPVADQFWGDRYGHVVDPFGFLWSIATRKEELTPQEIAERQAKVMRGAGS